MALSGGLEALEPAWMPRWLPMFLHPLFASNTRFINALAAAHVTFVNRNADTTRWTRAGSAGDGASSSKPLPYTLLYPSSGPGVTMRGVPYSVSI